jgi:hypothetical protein
MVRWVDYVLVILQLYFLLMNVTVERNYCHAPLEAGDTRFLVAETIAFCQQYNPLFLARPQWMVVATCTSAFGFLPFYLLIAFAAVTGRWKTFRLPISIFVGCKINALLFSSSSLFETVFLVIHWSDLHDRQRTLVLWPVLDNVPVHIARVTHSDSHEFMPRSPKNHRFYHAMEFLSTTPPPALVPYFAVEGPYLVSLALIIAQLLGAQEAAATTAAAADKRK